jgi:NTE family protein
LVGSLYAVGFSPQEIRAIVVSEKFSLMSQGKLPEAKKFFLYDNDYNASLLSIPFSKDSLIYKSLPTKLITPSLLDFELLRLLGIPSASVGENFDKLFIPFRCVSADIVNKEAISYKTGPLNEKIRASITYPFFMNAIRVDGKLMFDGGMYNNFPADVMYRDFDPDFIIGSNVSGNATAPREDDLLSQLTNMLVTYSNYELPCENGLMINQKLSVSTFDFANAERAINEGYITGLKYVDSLKKLIDRRIDPEALRLRRLAFRNKIKIFEISQVSATTTNNERSEYAEKAIKNPLKEERIDFETFEKRYFRTYAAKHIETIFPKLELLEDSTYRVNLKVQKFKSFQLDIGGHFSTRTVNTGFVGLRYTYVKRNAYTLLANSYFGRFYTSARGQFNFEPASKIPFQLSANFQANRWDFFSNFSQFSAEQKPSYLIQNETSGSVSLSLPIANTAKMKAEVKGFELNDSYYQDDNYGLKDTLDKTRFNGFSTSLSLTQNSLNRKQWATSGQFLQVKVKAVNGIELSNPGSTSVIKDDTRQAHKWISISGEYQRYVLNNRFFHLGFHVLGVFNAQPRFANYTASILATNTFEPLPDMSTFFLKEYRAPQQMGIGLNLVFSIRKNIDIRFDSYYHQPFKVLVEGPNGGYSQSQFFKGQSYLGAASAIYSSPFGPIRFTVNYFALQKRPFNFQLSYGYTIFNERANR